MRLKIYFLGKKITSHLYSWYPWRTASCIKTLQSSCRKVHSYVNSYDISTCFFHKPWFSFEATVYLTVLISGASSSGKLTLVTETARLLGKPLFIRTAAKHFTSDSILKVSPNYDVLYIVINLFWPLAVLARRGSVRSLALPSQLWLS